MENLFMFVNTQFPTTEIMPFMGQKLLIALAIIGMLLFFARLGGQGLQQRPWHRKGQS